MAHSPLRGSDLWGRVQAVTASALASGHLHSIPTETLDVRDGPLEFQLRVVDKLAHKSPALRERIDQTPAADDFNPFLPWDPALYVGELTPHHRCLLNKFNVVDQHILLVTTDFAEQRTPLNAMDFLAIAIALQARDGLVFYNGGTDAGASVRHKHLQMIPLPLSADCPFPFAPQLAASAPADGSPGRCASFRFAHRVGRCARHASLERTTEDNLARYRDQLAELGLSAVDGMMPPHNLLLTRDHLWVVPRRQGRYQGLPVNALGFAGTLLVKDHRQLSELRQLGPGRLLVEVAAGAEKEH